MKRLTKWFVGLTLAMAMAGMLTDVANGAQVRYWSSGRTLVVEPKMNFVPNTDIYYVRKAPDYDLYRFANTWYLVDNGVWYRADTWRGPYVSFDFANVPDEIATIPESYRHHWVAVRTDVSDGSLASPRTFVKKPKMTTIGSTNGVSYASRITDFDLYRYRSTWFLVEDGVWYKSDSWRGPFLSVRASKVPRNVLNVPSAYRHHWAAPA